MCSSAKTKWKENCIEEKLKKNTLNQPAKGMGVSSNPNSIKNKPKEQNKVDLKAE